MPQTMQSKEDLERQKKMDHVKSIEQDLLGLQIDQKKVRLIDY